MRAADLARNLEVSTTTIHRWERRERLPGPAHVHALAESLEVRADVVLAFVDGARQPAAPMHGLPGRGLRALRAARGLTGSALASFVGVAPHTVYNWERGGCRIPDRHLPALAEALQVRPKQLRDILRRPTPSPRPKPRHPLVVLRRRRGLSQTAAANLLEVNRGTLRRWETGTAPPLHALRKIARVYAMPIGQVARAAGVSSPPVLDPSRWRPGDLPVVLRTLREWSGLTQRELAERCGAAKCTVGAWENSRLQPGPRMRKRLETVHRLPAGALLGAYRRAN